MKRDAAIDEYLKTVRPASRELLLALRKTIHSAVPGVEECISYTIPAFRFRGEVIAGFQETVAGCSYYPFSGMTLKTLADDIRGYRHTRGALHFSPARRLPAGLVRKLLKTRIAENGGRPA